MLKVSIIIPVYNGEKYIREAIDSVLKQTYKDFEIIVIDDGSIDGTSKILKEYGSKIKLKSQKNKGQAAAINTGIKRAEGEYIAYLDSDDVYLPEKLEVQVNSLDRHPEIDLVYTDYYQIDKNGVIQRIIKSQPFDGFLLLQKNYIGRSTVMHRRECLDEVGFFDVENTGNDDWDMWIRISEKFKMDYIEKPLVKYRVHGENISLIRPRRVDYERWTKEKMLERSYERRGRPFWLKIKVMRAKTERKLGIMLPIIDQKFHWIWGGSTRILDYLERVVFNLKKSKDI